MNGRQEGRMELQMTRQGDGCFPHKIELIFLVRDACDYVLELMWLRSWSTWYGDIIYCDHEFLVSSEYGIILPERIVKYLSMSWGV